MLLEVGLESPLSADISGPAVKASSEGVRVSYADLNALNAEALEHLLDGQLVSLDNHASGR